MLARMVRKSAAALLVLLILLPFTAPFSTFDFAAPPTTNTSAPVATAVPSAFKDVAESVGGGNVLRHRFHAMPAKAAYGLNTPMIASAGPVVATPHPLRDIASRTTVLRI
jgi:hypothetical protein